MFQLSAARRWCFRCTMRVFLAVKRRSPRCLLNSTSGMSLMECGAPQNLPVDVVSRIFRPDRAQPVSTLRGSIRWQTKQDPADASSSQIGSVQPRMVHCSRQISRLTNNRQTTTPLHDTERKRTVARNPTLQHGTYSRLESNSLEPKRNLLSNVSLHADVA